MTFMTLGCPSDDVKMSKRVAGKLKDKIPAISGILFRWKKVLASKEKKEIILIILKHIFS